MSEKKRLTITISENIYEYLEMISKEKGLSKSAMITVSLENYRKAEK